MADSDEDEDEDDIYITNKSSNIEDELVTYLEEKREDRKVSKFYLNFIIIIIRYSLNIFL
jgi:hypothetical protein